MTDVVVRAEGLGKKYVLSHRIDRHDRASLRSALTGRVHRVLGRLTGMDGSATSSVDEEFWALKDSSFEVRRGEVVGLIGRNGAGKSTLLKLLSGITEPTEGRALIHGQVASLLEVGTGFHSELTGRENIFLNGAILGMGRGEVRRKFDEIVAFAGIDKFLDTPVKRYSSGMYVRLAFSIAAHLDPDVLIIDEVLAVGDAEFQKKCLGKVEEAAQNAGRAILFVSHNMGLITALCRNAILLDGGRIARTGPAHEVVSHYYASGKGTPYAVAFDDTRPGTGALNVTPLAAEVRGPDGAPSGEIDIRRPFSAAVRFRVDRPVREKAHVIVRFWNSEGQCAFVSTQTGGPYSEGIYEAECQVPADLLNHGIYFVDVALMLAQVGEQYAFDERSALCLVAAEPAGGQDALIDFAHGAAGVLRPRLDWAIRRIT